MQHWLSCRSHPAALLLKFDLTYVSELLCPQLRDNWVLVSCTASVASEACNEQKEHLYPILDREGLRRKAANATTINDGR